MKTFIAVISFILFLPIKAIPQVSETYVHPQLNFQFEASEGWINIPRSEDELIYEMMNPDSQIYVLLWYTETEQNAKKYLLKMAGMKDLMIDNVDPEVRKINNLDMWTINVSGYEDKIPAQMILGVSEKGRSEARPKENCLYITQIWCSKENYLRYENVINDILGSVKIN